MTAAVTAAGLLASHYAFKRYQENKRSKLPKEWVHVGHLKRLITYPVKSCAPILLDQAECSVMGLRDGWLRDRFVWFPYTDTIFSTKYLNSDSMFFRT